MSVGMCTCVVLENIYIEREILYNFTHCDDISGWVFVSFVCYCCCFYVRADTAISRKWMKRYILYSA